jgi:hypothetical protein
LDARTTTRRERATSEERGGEVSDEDKEFQAYCERAAAVVATWPEWKQNVLGWKLSLGGKPSDKANDAATADPDLREMPDAELIATAFQTASQRKTEAVTTGNTADRLRRECDAELIVELARRLKK